MLNTIQQHYGKLVLWILNFFPLEEDFSEEDTLSTVSPETGRLTVGRLSPNCNLDPLGKLIRLFRSSVVLKQQLGLPRDEDMSGIVDSTMKRGIVELATKLLITDECELDINAVERMEREGVYVALVVRGHKRTKMLMLSNGVETFSIHVLAPLPTTRGIMALS